MAIGYGLMIMLDDRSSLYCIAILRIFYDLIIFFAAPFS
jgi:hypothetical protein